MAVTGKVVNRPKIVVMKGLPFVGYDEADNECIHSLNPVSASCFNCQRPIEGDHWWITVEDTRRYYHPDCIDIVDRAEEKSMKAWEITTIEQLYTFEASKPSDVERRIAMELQEMAFRIEELKKGLMNRIDQLEVELNRAANWIDVGLGDPNRPPLGGHGINYSLVREIDLGCTELVVKVAAYGSVKAMAKLALTSGDKEE